MENWNQCSWLVNAPLQKESSWEEVSIALLIKILKIINSNHLTIPLMRKKILSKIYHNKTSKWVSPKLIQLFWVWFNLKHMKRHLIVMQKNHFLNHNWWRKIMLWRILKLGIIYSHNKKNRLLQLLKLKLRN